jgi:hypothetical protein
MEDMTTEEEIESIRAKVESIEIVGNVMVPLESKPGWCAKFCPLRCQYPFKPSPARYAGIVEFKHDERQRR